MKYLNYRILFFLIIVFVSSYIIYDNYFQKEKIDQNTNLKLEDENSLNSNIIKDIPYCSKDVKGNEYTISADRGEIDLNNTDIIFLNDVKAFINLIEKNESIIVVSDFGKYNTVNYDTIFSQNVKIQYDNNTIIGDYLDFSMNKSLLIISKNVVYTNTNNILKADVIELDTITKNTKIFMYDSKDKVSLESIR